MPGICRSNRINAGCRRESCSRKAAALSAVITSQPTPWPICAIRSRKSDSSSTARTKLRSRLDTPRLLVAVQDRANTPRQILDFVRLAQHLHRVLHDAPMQDQALAEARRQQHAQVRTPLAQLGDQIGAEQ